MTRLQSVRNQIAHLQAQLSGLRISQEEKTKISGLAIADPEMRKWAKNHIPIIEREIESVMRLILNAEAEESRLTR
jgi:hypothetical protein